MFCILEFHIYLQGSEIETNLNLELHKLAQSGPTAEWLSLWYCREGAKPWGGEGNTQIKLIIHIMECAFRNAGRCLAHRRSFSCKDINLISSFA